MDNSLRMVFRELRRSKILALLSRDPTDLAKIIRKSNEYIGFVTVPKDKMKLRKTAGLVCIVFGGKVLSEHQELREKIELVLHKYGYITNIIINAGCLQCPNFKFEIFASNDPRAKRANNSVIQKINMMRGLLESMNKLSEMPDQCDESDENLIPYMQEITEEARETIKKEGLPDRSEPINDKDIEMLKKMLDSDVGFDNFIKLT